MAETSKDILQDIYIAIDTAETAWSRYKAACIPLFDDAFKTHNNALQASKVIIQNRNEQGWAVLSFILTIGLGAWVPKILKPVEDGIDGLTASWVNTTLKQFASDDLKGVIKDTTLGKLKDAVVTASNGFEPVVEDTIVWGSRLEEGILERSLILKNGINEVKDKASQISVETARKMELAFRQNCPFIVDKPTDVGENFKKKFREDSELEMWAAWSRSRDKGWWEKNPNHRDLWDMWPIMNRMFALGVNEVGVWHPGRRSATIGGNWIKPGYLLSMIKMIEWAERRWHQQNTCQAPMVIPDFLKFPNHSSSNKCYVGTP